MVSKMKPHIIRFHKAYCSKCPHRMEKVVGFGCKGYVRGYMIEGRLELRCYTDKLMGEHKWLKQ